MRPVMRDTCASTHGQCSAAWPNGSSAGALRHQEVSRSASECLGIAEQEMPVDSRAYVNVAGGVAGRAAAGRARRLSFDGPERWESLADRMFLPVEEATDVILNHEGYEFREGDVASATPETLAGLFPFNYD